MHLARLAAEGDSEYLVAETDAEHRHARVHELLDLRHRIGACGRRIAGTVGEEHAVGLPLQHLLRGGGRRHDRELAPRPCELAQDVALQPIVDGHDMEGRLTLAPIAVSPAPLRLVPSVALAAGHLLGEIEPHHAGPGGGLAFQCAYVDSRDPVGLTLEALGMRDRDDGWTVEMQARRYAPGSRASKRRSATGAGATAAPRCRERCAACGERERRSC